jgi:hypothetical protein
MRRSRKTRQRILNRLLVVAAGAVLSCCLLKVGAEVAVQDTLSGTVQKAYVMHGLDGYTFMVELRTDDGQVHVLENDDSLVFWKWDSAKIQDRLGAGAQIRVHTAGPSIPSLSLFPNIVAIDRPLP